MEHKKIQLRQRNATNTDWDYLYPEIDPTWKAQVNNKLVASGTLACSATSSEWEATNPVLVMGEIGYDATNGLAKIGNGISCWNDLNYLVDASLLGISTLDLTPWSVIARLAATGLAQKVFKIGDKKIIKLTTNEEITLIILGFNHDDLVGGGKSGITFGMENLLTTAYPMNSISTNVGGWNDCLMRTSTMPTLLTQLPADLQSVIKTVYKKTTAGNSSKSIVTSADKLFLFSELEITNTAVMGYVDEGMQYEYWKTVKNGLNDNDRIKYWQGRVSGWWLRSPKIGFDTYFQSYGDDGRHTYFPAKSAYGVCIGFCV